MQIDPQILQTISIIVAVISIIVAFIIGIRSIRNFTVSRKAQVFISYQTQAYSQQRMIDLMEILNQWSWKDYDDFFQKYGPRTNPEAYAKFISVGGFYEGMARLLKKKIIDLDLMPENMAIGIVMFWEKIEPLKEGLIRDFKRSQSIELLEYLYNTVKTQKPNRISI